MEVYIMKKYTEPEFEILNFICDDNIMISQTAGDKWPGV